MKVAGWIGSVVLSLSFIGCTHPAPLTEAAATRRPALYDDGNVDLTQIFPSPAWTVISFSELKKFDYFWALSDIHGELKKLQRLLFQSGLIEKRTDKWHWVPSNTAGSRHLIVIDGDYIDRGPDSVGVVLFLYRMSEEAARNGSRIILLLGNHEAEFLADESEGYKHIEDQLLQDGNTKFDKVRELPDSLTCGSHDYAQHGPRVNTRELGGSKFGCLLRNLPLGAIVGNTLIAHSGFLDVSNALKKNPSYISVADLALYLSNVSNLKGEPTENADYLSLADKDNPYGSVINRHDWWSKHKYQNEMRGYMNLLGLSTVIMGHDPGALGIEKSIAISKDGWIVKIDAGMERFDNQIGRILKCRVSLIVQKQNTSSKIRFVDSKNTPLCTQVGSAKNSDDVDLVGQPIPVSNQY